MDLPAAQVACTGAIDAGRGLEELGRRLREDGQRLEALGARIAEDYATFRECIEASAFDPEASGAAFDRILADRKELDDYSDGRKKLERDARSAARAYQVHEQRLARALRAIGSAGRRKVRG